MDITSAPQMSPITVDANNLFRTVGRYFPDPTAAIREVIQNAYRATLHLGDQARIAVLLREGKSSRDWTNIEVRDNGRGIQDFGRMLSLSTSDWEEPIRSTQDPAGMGVAAALRFCDRTLWESNGQLIEVNGHQFFNFPQYRADLTPRRIATQSGTIVTMEDFRLPLGRVLGELQGILAPYRQVFQLLVDDKPHPYRSLSDVLKAAELVDANPRYEVYRVAGEHAFGTLEQRLLTGSRSSVIWHGHVLPIGNFVRPAPFRFQGREMQGDPHSLGGLSAQLIVIPLVDGVVTPVLPARQAVVEDLLLDHLLRDLLTAETTRHAASLARRIDRAITVASEGGEPSRIESSVIRWMGPDFTRWAVESSQGILAYRDPSDGDLNGSSAYPLRYGETPGQYVVESVLPWLGGGYDYSIENLDSHPRLHLEYRDDDEGPRLLVKARTLFGIGDHGIPRRHLLVDVCDDEVGHPQYARLGKGWKPHQGVRAWLIPDEALEAAERDSTPPWNVPGAEEISLKGLAWSRLDRSDPSIPRESFAFGSLSFAEQAIGLWCDSLSNNSNFDDGEADLENLRRDANQLTASLSGRLALSRSLNDLRDCIPGWDGLQALTIDPRTETVTFLKGTVECRELYR